MPERERLATRGSLAKSSPSTDKFACFLKTETDKVSKVIKVGDIKLE